MKWVWNKRGLTTPFIDNILWTVNYSYVSRTSKKSISQPFPYIFITNSISERDVPRMSSLLLGFVHYIPSSVTHLSRFNQISTISTNSFSGGDYRCFSGNH